MKKCPFCAEDIQDEAIKCKHCGEFLQPKPKQKWHQKTSVFVIALLMVGPLALPLLWANPAHSRTKKIVISIVVIILTYALIKITMQSMQSIGEYYKLVF